MDCMGQGTQQPALEDALSKRARDINTRSCSHARRMRDSLTLNHERLYAEYQARLEGLESTVERMGQVRVTHEGSTVPQVKVAKCEGSRRGMRKCGRHRGRA